MGTRLGCSGNRDAPAGQVQESTAVSAAARVRTHTHGRVFLRSWPGALGHAGQAWGGTACPPTLPCALSPRTGPRACGACCTAGFAACRSVHGQRPRGAGCWVWARLTSLPGAGAALAQRAFSQGEAGGVRAGPGPLPGEPTLRGPPPPLSLPAWAGGRPPQEGTCAACPDRWASLNLTFPHSFFHF